MAFTLCENCTHWRLPNSGVNSLLSSVLFLRFFNLCIFRISSSGVEVAGALRLGKYILGVVRQSVRQFRKLEGRCETVWKNLTHTIGSVTYHSYESCLQCRFEIYQYFHEICISSAKQRLSFPLESTSVITVLGFSGLTLRPHETSTVRLGSCSW